MGAGRLPHAERVFWQEFWVLLFIALLATGLISGKGVLVAFGATGMLAMAVSWLWNSVALSEVTLERHLSQTHTFAGEELRMVLSVTNGKARATGLAAHPRPAAAGRICRGCPFERAARRNVPSAGAVDGDFVVREGELDLLDQERQAGLLQIWPSDARQRGYLRLLQEASGLRAGGTA